MQLFQGLDTSEICRFTPSFTFHTPHLSPSSPMKVLISAVGQEFNFLDNFEYMYDSSSESETPGPFTMSFQALNIEYQEDEKEEEKEEEREEEGEEEREDRSGTQYII